MIRGRHEWYCTAKNPRCGFVAPLADTTAMLEHVTANEPDLRREKPLPGIVAGPVLGGLEDVA